MSPRLQGQQGRDFVGRPERARQGVGTETETGGDTGPHRAVPSVFGPSRRTPHLLGSRLQKAVLRVSVVGLCGPPLYSGPVDHEELEQSRYKFRSTKLISDVGIGRKISRLANARGGWPYGQLDGFCRVY